ncbi:MAG: SDR family oxidoreductase [Acidimicrobiales bacterium]
MRVLVTGGSGFLGGSVIPQLIGAGHQPTALVRSTVAATRVTDLGATAVHGDLDDPASVDAAFASSGGEALVNLASLGFGHAPTIVAAAEEAGLTRAVFVSTTSIFTRFATASKPVRIAAEETVRSSALDWTIIRPTMIYGTPSDRNMARLLKALRRLPVLPLPDGGRALQQPVHVDDLATAIVTALDRPVSIYKAYDVAGPQALTFRRVVEESGRAVDRPPRLVSVPLAPMVGLVRVYQALAPSPRLKSEQVARLAEDKAVDIEAARADLDFRPRTFAEGIGAEAAMLL